MYGPAMLKWKQPREIRRAVAAAVIRIFARWIILTWLCVLVFGALAVFAMQRVDPTQVPFVKHLMLMGGGFITLMIAINLLSLFATTTYVIDQRGLVRRGKRVESYPWDKIKGFRIVPNDLYPGLKALQFKVKEPIGWQSWSFDAVVTPEETLRSILLARATELADEQDAVST